jgi:predicted alpha/beta superfamily hydrolase
MFSNYRLVNTVLILLFIPFWAHGQYGSEPSYLKSFGILDSVYSNTLDEIRKVYVQFPANYNPDDQIKYPVIYIIDGEVLLPTVQNVQSFYSGGFTPEMILVGISNDKNRTRDLTTSEIREMYGRPYIMENGKAADFIKFIELELIPFVESKYPVTNFRTLIGHSYGGLFTLYTLIHHSHLFSNYIAIDPSLDWDGQKLTEEARAFLSKNDYSGNALFMSLSGQLHMQNPQVTIDNVMEDDSDFTLFARSNILFSKIVKQNLDNGLEFNWKFYPRDLHGTVAFPSIMEGLIVNFEWFQMENTYKINDPSTSIKELNEIIKYRAKKLEKHFNYPVPPFPQELLNMLGYMCLDSGQIAKSKMFFEFAMEYYPESPNAFDSMADFYERNKEIDKALFYVTKAFEMSGNDYYKNRIVELKQKK